MRNIKTWDIIPYEYDENGKPKQENEYFTIIWVDKNIDKYGKQIKKKQNQTSVFDQLTNEEFEIIIQRLKLL